MPVLRLPGDFSEKPLSDGVAMTMCDAVARATERSLEDVTVVIKRLVARRHVVFAESASGTPAVFEGNEDLIPDEDRPVASAILSYFDKHGIFDSSNGHVLTTDEGVPFIASRLRLKERIVRGFNPDNPGEWDEFDQALRQTELLSQKGVFTSEDLSEMSAAVRGISDTLDTKVIEAQRRIDELHAALRKSPRAVSLTRDEADTYPSMSFDDWRIKIKPEAIRNAAREARVSFENALNTMRQWNEAGLLKFVSVNGQSHTYVADETTVLSTEKGRALMRGLGARIIHTSDVPKITVGPMPWDEAIEMQGHAMAHLTQSVAYMSTKAARADINKLIGAPEWSDNTLDIDRSWTLPLLRNGETYSISGDARDAILSIADSLPHDVALDVGLLPGRKQGWWWMSPALDVPTADNLPQVSGLLWGVDNPESLGANEDAVVNQPVGFMAFCRQDIGGGLKPYASTSWQWRPGETFHDMIARTTVEYRGAYGETGPWSKAPHFGEKGTLKAVADLTLFWLAACMWMRQEIVVLQPGNVGRHRRKRYQHEHKLAALPPDVKVVALRKMHYERPESDEPREAGEARAYKCRWTVKGHPRNQAYGPGRLQRKLIWVEPFVKGPDNAPLRIKQKNVFAVMR